MIYIDKSDTPHFWESFRQQHPQVRYMDLQESSDGIKVRRELRNHNLQQQHYLCAYCCKRIDMEHSLNEHIKPESEPKYFSESMEYRNIVASCKTEGSAPTCSASKKNTFDENLFVSPLDEDCSEHFDFAPDGEIFSRTEKGQYTIRLLNLNTRRLKQARAAQFKSCEWYEKDQIQEIFLSPDQEGCLQPYADMIRYCFDKGLFD